jgi:hypothetical protein
MGSIIDGLSGALSGGTVGTGMKIGLIGLAIVAAFVFRYLLNKWRCDAARKEEAEKQISDAQNLANKNKQENQNTQADSKASDDFLTK